MSSQHVPAMGNNVNPPRLPDSDMTVTTASVAPSPPPAPAAPPPRVASADNGESHSMFRSLTPGNWFGHDDPPQPPAPTQAVAQQPKPRPTVEAKADTAHHAHPAPPAHPQVAERKPVPPQAPAATASAAPPAPAPQAPALMAGAAPVVSTTSFNNRWAEVH
jgi:hypothetical protein